VDSFEKKRQAETGIIGRQGWVLTSC